MGQGTPGQGTPHRPQRDDGPEVQWSPWSVVAVLAIICATLVIMTWILAG